VKEWCEFHLTYGHHTKQCLTLANQLQRLRGKDWEGEYLPKKNSQIGEACDLKGNTDHESPVLGDLNEIADNFAGSGITSASKKR